MSEGDPDPIQLGVIEADYDNSNIRIRFKNTSGATIVAGDVKYHATLIQA